MVKNGADITKITVSEHELGKQSPLLFIS